MSTDPNYCAYAGANCPQMLRHENAALTAQRDKLHNSVINYQGLLEYEQLKNEKLLTTLRENFWARRLYTQCKMA